MRLASQNASGVTGTAAFTDLGGGKLRVEIRADGAGPGPQPAHIHEGSCAQLHPVPKYSLGLVTNGALDAEVVVQLEAHSSILDVTASPHAIHLHKSPDEMPVHVACADTGLPR